MFSIHNLFWTLKNQGAGLRSCLSVHFDSFQIIVVRCLKVQMTPNPLNTYNFVHKYIIIRTFFKMSNDVNLKSKETKMNGR